MISNSRVSLHNRIQSGPFSRRRQQQRDLHGKRWHRCHAKLQSEVRAEPLEFCSNVLCGSSEVASPPAAAPVFKGPNGLHDGEDGNLSICFTP